jgi:hypothetical protein
MVDETVLGRIEELVAEEHALQRREEGDATRPAALAEDRRRLHEVSVELDRCWDLLRRRRALRGAGEDQTDEEPPDASLIEEMQ